MDKEFVWTEDLVIELLKIYNYSLFKEFIASNFNIPVATMPEYLQKHIDTFKESQQRKPLFTTEDNVVIYEGAEYWFVDNKWEVLYNDHAHKLSQSGYFPETYKYFSTEEKANEYVLMNKPCLSINDFISCTSNPEIHLKNNKPFNKLLKLAKQKINQ